MLILLNQAWPWIIFGLLLMAWGLFELQLNLFQWVKIILKLIFGGFSDPTKGEKREIASTPMDEAMASNIGCSLLLFGIICLVYGVVRWLT